MTQLEMDRMYLELALEEAKQAAKENTFPIGAVLVGPNHELISKGRNKVYSFHDATAHAEIDAIRESGNFLLLDENRYKCTIYTTVEPCPMCTGAILFANITRVVWILNDPNFGGFRSFKEANLFEKKLTKVSMLAQPFEDLAIAQCELMENWEKNRNRNNVWEYSTENRSVTTDDSKCSK
ncbi:nucleoside deaminase [Bacillus salitolerans]|uniref:Nucleoside deaminase n=1 Tax=Bacillus salitolerans TaxID=1437434 RepID=A0ABW4LUH7_9BACI